MVAHVYGFSISRGIEDRKFSLRNLANYLLNITHFYDHTNFEIERPKKFVLDTHYWKIEKLTPLKSKIRKSEHDTHVDLGPKRCLGPRDPIIGSMGYGAGGGGWTKSSEPTSSDDLITKHYISLNTFFYLLCIRLCFI